MSRHMHRTTIRLEEGLLDEAKREAARRKVALLILPTTKAIEVLEGNPEETNAVLHVTC